MSEQPHEPGELDDVDDDLGGEEHPYGIHR
jgi:hypothetical protein